jgi:uncharacterized protein (TIGR01244 family)
MNFRELDKQVLVADAPMWTTNMAEAAARGVTLVVNNRPDHEEAGQLNSADAEQAARAEGMDYVHIPVRTEFTGEKVEALTEALATAEGRVLVFCKTGTRAAYLWALARAREGAVPEALVANAARAGYNLRPILPWMKPREDEAASS